MPKPRGGNKGGKVWGWNSDGGGGREGKYYYEHDDRVGDTIRRVSFKTGTNNNRMGKHGSKKWDMAIRTTLEDDDVDMNTAGSSHRNSGRYNPYSSRGQGNNNSGGGGGGTGRGSSGRRKGGRNSPPVNSRKRFSDNVVTWFKVTIPYGARYSKEYILKTLLSHTSPDIFIPLCYEIRGSDSSFYVDDARTAEKLASADKRITTIKGFKLLVKVRPDLPRVELNDAFKEKIKNAMVKRYSAEMNMLDLSRFHTDPDLSETCTVALFRPNMLVAVIDVIAENVPELGGLNLSCNKLYGLEHLSTLNQKLPKLKALHIGKNKLRDIHNLDCLEGLRIEELVLDGNPLCDKFQEKAAYVSEVRKRFPKVLKLDGFSLPPPIVFDVNDDFKLPPSKANFLVMDEGMKVVRPFLEQYYQIYDSDDRQSLMNAYHENAMFSLSAAYPPGQSSTTSPKLANYMSDSRNLIRIKDNTRRQRLLYNGKLKVVSFISSLPKTKHDPQSFTVDLSIFTPQLIMMTVTGVFLEPGNARNPPLRAFNRVFVIIPYGGGFCIINEQLFVTNPTDEQIKTAFKTIPPAATLSPPTPAPTPVPIATSPQGVLVDENTKLQMIETFALQSGMNVSWARKCLDETKWDYQQATFVFSELNAKGTIPAEAFIK